MDADTAIGHALFRIGQVAVAILAFHLPRWVRARSPWPPHSDFAAIAQASPLLALLALMNGGAPHLLPELLALAVCGVVGALTDPARHPTTPRAPVRVQAWPQPLPIVRQDAEGGPR